MGPFEKFELKDYDLCYNRVFKLYFRLCVNTAQFFHLTLLRTQCTFLSELPTILTAGRLLGCIYMRSTYVEDCYLHAFPATFTTIWHELSIDS